ncbi:MAG: hypothetical protein HQM09_09465 [Candidatus Riflebacteria bacterium]|nr:hypothetical protein [Candidatus Riflebacteria bacterium]
MIPNTISFDTGFHSMGIATRRFPMIYVGTSDGTANNGSLEVIDGGTKHIWKSLSLSTRPDALCVNRLGDIVWVGDKTSDKAEKVDVFQTNSTWSNVFNMFVGGGTVDKICGITYDTNDTLFVTGHTNLQTDMVDNDLPAPIPAPTPTPTPIPTPTTLPPDSDLNNGAFTIPFHHSNRMITSYLPDKTPSPPAFGGLRITSSADCWNYPADLIMDSNWPNHLCSAIALSPDDGLLAIHSPDSNGKQMVYVYDLSGDWPPKNPTLGKYSYQRFNKTCPDLTSMSPVPNPLLPCPFDNPFSNAGEHIGFSFNGDSFFDQKVLRCFMEFDFGAGSQWNIFGASQNGIRIAVGTQNVGFTAPGVPVPIAGSSPGSDPPWSTHTLQGYETTNFSPSAKDKIWWEWYDIGGGVDRGALLFKPISLPSITQTNPFPAGFSIPHRSTMAVSAFPFLFDTSLPANTPPFGFNFHSKPNLIYATDTGSLNTVPMDNVRLQFSRNGEWLFILNKRLNKINARHLFNRTSSLTDLQWTIPATDPGFNVADFCLSPDGGHLWVTANLIDANGVISADGSKVYALSVGNELDPDFFTLQNPVVKLSKPALSINAQQNYPNHHVCRKINDLPTNGLWAAQAVNFKQKIYVISGLYKDSTPNEYAATSDVQIFDPMTNSFDPTPLTIAKPFGEGGATVLDDMIITYGGVNGSNAPGDFQNNVQRYWPDGGDTFFNGISTDYSNVESGGARWLSMATLDGFIYSFNGYTFGGTYSGKIGSIGCPRQDFPPTVQMSKWVTVNGSVIPPNFGGQAIRCRDNDNQDKIFYIGGWNGPTSPHISNTNFCFDPRNNLITPKAPCSFPRAAFAACQFQGKIYIFGGSNDFTTLANQDSGSLASVECYDPNVGPNGTWTSLPSLPQPINSLAGAAFGGKMYLFGGRDSSHNILTDIYEYEL